ncbi:hypothetical protein MNBD_GAMMA26-2629 [hydrothermal vent metagenome]|uniref:Uncharacterized protein n=1 Tax=hydrothermal vent metagenome TaxID=652676 RepID=A0A3B1AUE8_9ZZZZ
MPNAPIELLIIDPSRGAAEAYISTLRNAGIAVHDKRVDTEKKLVDALNNHDIDLIICACTPGKIKLSHAQKLCTGAKPDIPFLVLYGEGEASTAINAVKHGARDFISKENTKHLHLVVNREIADLHMRRKVKELQRQLQECEERCAALIGSSQNAIAYIHEGMHISANSTYLNIFGNLEMEDIEGLPIMDMITHKEHKQFKDFLRNLQSTSTASELEATCQRSNGTTFAAKLEFSSTIIDGEPCTQIVVHDQTKTVPGYEETPPPAATKKPTPKQEKATAATTNETKRLIAKALKEDKLHLVFQPIVSLQGDSRENYAVMVQLLNENGEDILPGRLREEAAQTGQSVAVDHWIIKKSIQEVSRRRQDGRRINFFLTISGPGIADPSTLLLICDTLRDSQAKGAWLTIQLQETDLRSDTQAARKLIESLQKIKCQIAITHFGLLPEPESILEQLPVNFIKFDPAFIENLDTNPGKQDNLNKINSMVQERGIKTIATAVEDASSLAVLWTVGVNYTQGHFLQEPSNSIDYDFTS